MALPISGPILKGQSDRSLYWSRSGYTQARPYDLVLSCSYIKGAVSSGAFNRDLVIRPSLVAYGFAGWYDAYGRLIDSASNSARERFVSGIQTRANLAVDLAEYHQSTEMITAALQRMVGVVRAVRKKDFGLLLRSVDPRGRKALLKRRRPTWKKAFADNFLEAHFGWQPLMADIHDAAHIMSKPLNQSHQQTHSSERFSYENLSGDHAPDFYDSYGRGLITVKVGGYVQCTNPALHLASQFGLTNPLALGYELIPFSFVLDWFSSVGQFISSIDEFAGLELVRPYTVYFFQQTGENYGHGPEWDPPSQSATWSNVSFSRGPGIPSVKLALKPLKMPSLTRALTAASLLIQQLKR
jgi:hypothetical protein